MKENNFMFILSDKQAKSHTKKRLKKGHHKRETESLLIVAENKARQNNKCWLRNERDETISHKKIEFRKSEFKKAQRE